MKQNTEETVYNNIKFFVFNNWSLKDNFGEMPRLRDFVNKLFDYNNESVYPFDKKTTDNIRIFYAIGDWKSIIENYKKINVDIINDDWDIMETASILHKYILYPESFKKDDSRA